MSDPQRLYTANEIAKMLGMTRHWVLEHHSRTGAPQARFTAVRGSRMTLFWTADALDHWRAYYAGADSIPRVQRTSGYSDHNAVNQVGNQTVTWKLSWRNTHDGGAMWWFSTPDGWYVSNDDGRTWDYADVMIRPGDYRYFHVTGNVNPARHVATVLRSATKLRQRLQSNDNCIDITPSVELTSG